MMKVVVRPQPSQLPSRIRLTATTTQAFVRDKYIAHGYRSLEATVIGGGGKGGTGGGGYPTDKLPDRPSTLGTYFAKGGGGAGGNGGGQKVTSYPLDALPAGAIPATVGAAAQASVFNGVTAIAGATGGNGGDSSTNGNTPGGAGVAPTPAAGSNSVKGDNGLAGTVTTISGHYYWGGGDGGEGGDGYTDPVTGSVNGKGGAGGDSNAGFYQGSMNQTGKKAGAAGAVGQAGVVILNFSTIQHNPGV